MINKTEIEKAQNSWGNGIITIGKLKDNPKYLIEKIIEDFRFKTPNKLPKICSLISGYFSYDAIRYIEKIPNNCKTSIERIVFTSRRPVNNPNNPAKKIC